MDHVSHIGVRERSCTEKRVQRLLRYRLNFLSLVRKEKSKIVN
jgi:hypothetical protein